MNSAPPTITPGSMLDWALRYIRLGWPVFPLGVRSKMPMIPAKQGGHAALDATLDPEKAREWWGRWPKANIGLATGIRFFAFDVDVLKGGADSLETFAHQFGPLPDTISQVTGTGGTHYLFQLATDFTIPNTESVLAQGIDTRGHHGYIVAAPSVHPDTKREYFWDGATEIEEQEIALAPAWMIDRLRQHVLKPRSGAAVVQAKIPKGQQHRTLVSIAGSLRRRGMSAEEIFALLKVANETRCTEPGPERNIRRIADSVARYAPDAKYDLFAAIPAEEEPAEAKIGPEDVEAAVDAAIEKDDPVAVTRLAPEIGRLRPQFRVVLNAKIRLKWKRDFPWADFNRAVKDEIAKYGGVESSDGRDIAEAAAGGDEGGNKGGSGTPDLTCQPHTDAGNGERLVAMFGRDIRYCIEMKTWLLWDEKRWAVDSAGVILQKAKLMAREMYKQAIGRDALEEHARASESHRALKAAIACAATEPGIPVSASDLDQQPFLLNCPNGVVDLKTGKLLPHERGFLITKLCPIEYDSNAACPRFQSFVEWAMGGGLNANPDAELPERVVRLVGFLQRSFGYALTSDVSEKALFVFYGNKGNNGKTTLLTLFRHLLGKDYSSQIAIETVMAAKSQDATMRADLADLRGARFVVTSEVEKEHRLNEGKIKFITAGLSEIKACRKYENPIEFPASHKLFMDCNWRPNVKGTDDAIWSRLKLVPFEVRIDKSDIDKDLPAKLRAELPGVLAWAVRGCMAWMKEGLGDPPEVSQAGLEWREHDDPLKEFLEDCCATGDELFVKCTDLGAAYEIWCKQNRERFPIGRESFNERMEAKGFQQNRSRRITSPGETVAKQARTWEGVELKPEMIDALRRFSAPKPREREPAAAE